MSKRRLNKLGKTVVAIGSISLFSTAIHVGFLHAQDAVLIYSETSSVLKEEVKQITSMQVKQGNEIIKTCTYPEQSELCDGIELEEGLLYRNRNLPPGVIKENGYQPYIYEINYVDTSERSSQLVVQMERGANEKLKNLQDQVLHIGANTLDITDTEHILFTSDDPLHVHFEGNVVTIDKNAKQTISIMAVDEGSATMAGGTKTITCTILYETEANTDTYASVASEDPLENKENVVRSSYTIEPEFWLSSQNTDQITIELNNSNKDYTQNNFKDPPEVYDTHDTIRLQAQYVNILEPSKARLLEGYTKANLQDLPQDKIDQLFQGSTWISSKDYLPTYDCKKYDASKPYETGVCENHEVGYVDPSKTADGLQTMTWIDDLSLEYPQADGLYLVRYRLRDTRRASAQNPDRGMTIPTCKEWSSQTDATGKRICNKGTVGKEPALVDKGYFDYERIIGQDSEAPAITISTKNSNEDTWIQYDETAPLRSDYAMVKIKAEDAISGVVDLKYQFVKDGDKIIDDTWNDVPSSGILSIPNAFKGKLHLYASDQVYDEQTPEKGRRDKAISIEPLNSDYIKVGLPVSSNAWQSIEEMTVTLDVPSTPIDYDGVYVRFQTKNKAVIEPIYLEKERFQNNSIRIPLPNGEYTIQAEVVKKQGSIYSPIDSRSIKETSLRIDHTAQLDVVLQPKVNQSHLVELQVTTGPSGVKEIKRVLTLGNGKEMSTTIPLKNGSYEDVASINGTYTYTLTNNASKVSTPKQIQIRDIDQTEPVIEIMAKDKTQNIIHSGEEADGYVDIKAENINSNSDPNKKIEVCITTKKETTCKEYHGEVIRVEENGNVIFRDKDHTDTIYGEFEVKIKGNIDLGTITIEKETEYTKQKWFHEDQIIQVSLNGGDEGIQLEYRMDQGEWQSTSKRQVPISFNEKAETSNTHTLEVRSRLATTSSQSKQIYVNIDKVTPKLTMEKEKGKGILNFQVQVGKSGLVKAEVTDEQGTIDLTSYIDGNHLRSYDAPRNGSYTFTIHNGAGKQGSATIHITDLKDSDIIVRHMLIKDNQEAVYDGGWTNGNIRVQLSNQVSDDFVRYEVSEDGTTWKVCDDHILYTNEQHKNYSYRLLKKDGTYAESVSTYPINIDKSAPSDPVITFTTLHDDALSKLLRAMTFQQFMNKAQEASITSKDSLSKVMIYYQEAKEDGSFDEDKTSTAWKKYDTSLRYEQEGALKLYAYAIDEAGNSTDVIDSDAILYDFSAPLLHGIKKEEVEGYIPRVITYEDILSGIDEEASVLTLQEESIALSQELLLKEIGTYQFTLYDRASNVLQKEFTLKKIPSPEDMDGSEDEKDLIDEIEKEYEENKDALDEETKKDIEDQIQDMIDAHEKNRIHHVEDKESGAILDGIEDTSFPQDTVLKVRNITAELSMEEQATYQDQIYAVQEHLGIQDVFEITLWSGEEEIPLTGKATLQLPYEKEVEEAFHLQGELVTLPFTYNQRFIVMDIEQTGRYAFAQMNAKDGWDQPEPRNDSFAGNLNTGDEQKLWDLSYLVGGSVLLLYGLTIQKQRREKR